LMVSLDGGPETHDRVRSRRDGASTYLSVTNTVERAIERGLRPSISITLTELSLDGVSEAVAFALQRQLPFNLNFYRECSSTGLGRGTSPLTPRPERLLEAMKGVFELIGRYPAYPLALGAILDRTRLDVPHNRTCSAGRDYMVVDSQGRVSACQMLLDVPWTDLEEQDPLDRIRQRGMDLFVPVDEQGECGQCPWRMACSGGCPLMRGSTLHDDYCRVYRALLPELVRLEAKRLIVRRSVH
jgi:radical SAM protein with 4Fe4S-binding SPASM domain